MIKTPYQVNLRISAGGSFYREFTLINADGTLMDLTDHAFYARVAKHTEALNAIETTDNNPVWKFIDLNATIVSAVKGIYSIGLDAQTTTKLEEGKYLYNVVMKDIDGNYTQIHNGLMFVDRALGGIIEGSVDPNYP